MRTTVDHGLSPSQVQKIKSIISQSAPEAERVALFGSRANGTYKNHSDIDLVIYGDVDRATINRLFTLFLESNIPYKVDVTAYKLISYPPLKQHIDDHNKTLFTQTELNPVFAEAYHNRGNAKSNLGQHQEAIADYNKAIELNPVSAEAYYNRGTAKSNWGQHREAIADFDKAIELNPNNAIAYNNRGLANKALGRTQEADEDFKMVAKLNSDEAS